MPIPTPFYSRTSPFCTSHEWRDWAGYLAAATYEHSHEREYYAIRNSAALIDVSPLYKYQISGPQAFQLVDRLVTRAVNKCAVGQVMYTPWCDDDGKVIDDGTISRLAEDTFRITAAESNLAWFQDCGYGLDAVVADVSTDLAALALQGPLSRQILKGLVAGFDLEAFKYYRLAQARVKDIPLTITRTGYTGDLGYELWVAPEHAHRLWDLVVERGSGYGISPAGMVALDIARIEAGLLLIQVDYISSRKALIADQKSSPFELGLGWTVNLDKGEFIGRRALITEQQAGPKWQLVGLEVSWESLEDLYAAVGLAPQVAGRASRSAAPVYQGNRQIGQATSHTFSPLLKKYIALASLESRSAALGSPVKVEITVEYARRQAHATVVKPPFFNPPRKRE